MTHANKHLRWLCLPLTALLVSSAVADDYEWLEDVLGDRSLAWVEDQNSRSLPQIESYPGYQPLYDNALAILNSSARIPEVMRLGDYYYNFWQDAEHVRGIYRRATLEEDPQWQTVLDIDALALRENANWVYKGVNCLYPEYRHCLVSLSDGGADAVVTREFDMQALRFVEDGFILPEAKPNIAWIDRDTLFVGSDFGPGSLTDSGYPRLVKIWHRGTPLGDAQQVFETDRTSVSSRGYGRLFSLQVASHSN